MAEARIADLSRKFGQRRADAATLRRETAESSAAYTDEHELIGGPI